MAHFPDSLRHAIRLFAANFFVASGAEKGSGLPLSFLWSGPPKHRAYFQERIFGSNPVTITPIGRRPMALINKLMARFDCSLAIVVSGRRFIHLLQKPGDFCLPLWVDCDVNLQGDRPYARSESIRADLSRMRRNELDWKLTSNQRDFESFFKTIYLPTITSSHGDTALPSSFEKRLTKFQAGSLQLLQVTRGGEIVAGGTIDFDMHIPTLRECGVLNGSPEIRKTGAITAVNVFTMDYLAAEGYPKVGFGLSRSFLDDGVLNYKRKFRSVIVAATDDSLLLRVRHLDEATRSMLRSSPCISWQGSELCRTYFRDSSVESTGHEKRINRGNWHFALDALSVFDVSGESLRLLESG